MNQRKPSQKELLRSEQIHNLLAIPEAELFRRAELFMQTLSESRGWDDWSRQLYFLFRRRRYRSIWGVSLPNDKLQLYFAGLQDRLCQDEKFQRMLQDERNRADSLRMAVALDAYMSEKWSFFFDLNRVPSTIAAVLIVRMGADRFCQEC